MLKRPSNKPRSEIERLARAAQQEHGGPTLARIYYKYDCGQCGSRERCPEPSVLPEQATCTVCGHVTRILGGGFQLQIRRDTSIPWDETVNTLLVRKPYESDKGDA